MAKLNFSCILLLLLLCSCSVEKINLSPVSNQPFPMSGNILDKPGEKNRMIVYSSEITNLLASFPKFRSDAVNTEVLNLKIQLKDYIGGLSAHNIIQMQHSNRKFEKSYKKLQKLRKYLNKDEDEVLSRYLVRIKTNMTFLNSNLPQNSASSL